MLTLLTWVPKIKLKITSNVISQCIKSSAGNLLLTFTHINKATLELFLLKTTKREGSDSILAISYKKQRYMLMLKQHILLWLQSNIILEPDTQSSVRFLHQKVIQASVTAQINTLGLWQIYWLIQIKAESVLHDLGSWHGLRKFPSMSHLQDNLDLHVVLPWTVKQPLVAWFNFSCNSLRVLYF